MKLKITTSFRKRLNDQVEYISKDKPSAARKFKSDILCEIREIAKMPYKCRKSIFFDREEVRDLVFKGYIIVYRINSLNESIEVFGFSKYEDNPFEK
jgi:plasmid stabilization system protein ParE